MSSLRDAIRDSWSYGDGDIVDRIAESVTAWLSEISEGEIEAAARAVCEWFEGVVPVSESKARKVALAALAASREVLIPKEARVVD